MEFKTRVISVTPNAEAVVLYCARVSNPKNQESEEKGLIKYLIKKNHWSPFEMANMVVGIETSRAISAQILRHKSFTFQEFSQRYSEVEESIVYPARRQDVANRQNSVDDLSLSEQEWFKSTQETLNAQAQKSYKEALNRGIAKEQARFLLPLSTKTKLYMNGTLRSWIHYIQLRTETGTQLEHIKIANSIKSLFIKEFPLIGNALSF